MALSITDNAKKLWDAWNIRGLIILSLSLQACLILFARLRKGRCARKFYFRWPIWFAYLSADWVAIYAIGLIFSSDGNSTCTSTSPSPPKDILVFWASFLLLHLGGPDNITSYALEDNEFWKRHLFVLLLQVGFTLYAFLKSFSKNELWLPTILVLFAGIMKYAERNIALFGASFDHFGKDWVSPHVKRGADKGKGETGTGLPIPIQFHDTEDHTSLLGTTVQLFGNIKSALVGPLLKIKEQMRIRDALLNIERSQKVLQVLEIELSLLYDVLHTKLPVIDGKSGFNLRIANFGCILLAIITFSLAKWHYQLREFDMLLTYGLLIAALALDSLSIMLLVKYSDWYAIAHFKDTVKKDAASKVIERQHRWCNEVSQLNCLTYHVKGMQVCLNKLADILHLRSSLKVLKGFRCQSARNVENPLWQFIYYEVRDFPEDTRINEVWLERGKVLLKDVMNGKQKKMLDELDYTQSLLVWHIATELCYQKDNKYEPKSKKRRNYRRICKLLSDYMFYLAVKQPTIMDSVLDNWSTMFKKISKMIQSEVPWSFFLNEKNVSRKILDMKVEENDTDSVQEVEKDNEDDGDNVENSLPSHGEVEISLSSAVLLVRGLEQQDNHYPWKLMSKIWVELMCYAAINCRPNVHAQQVSQGGELLALVWLLMNHMGLGTKNYTTLKKSSRSPARHPESESEDEGQP
ncbi:hypothetical protein SLA2020_248540 [Shorea laevis]